MANTVAARTQESPANCKYREYPCPHSAVNGKDLCIFHLPVAQKDPGEFWRHFAALFVGLARAHSDGEIWRAITAHPTWILEECDGALSKLYQEILEVRRDASFQGFIFPSMDRDHHLMNLVFGPSSFVGAKFAGEAIFQRTEFTQKALFHGASFDGEVSFHEVHFAQEAVFLSSSFLHAAGFWMTRFDRSVVFSRALFADNAEFGMAQFYGPVYLNGTIIDGVFNLGEATLRNRMLFQGTRFGPNSAVLLWGLDFVRGTSDLYIGKGMQKGDRVFPRHGSITNPEGQVVFRDIAENINRVSFLHTDIFSDRPNVRFVNVIWNINPRLFLFDVRFTTGGPDEWAERDQRVEVSSLYELFSANDPIRQGTSTAQQAAERAAATKRLRGLITADVERIAREIRRSYETFGNYPDAGDYYVAEMEYRRKRNPWWPWRNLLRRTSLQFYNWISRYGESPGRALGWLFGLAVVCAAIYYVAGFRFQGRLVSLRAGPCGAIVADVLCAVAYSFANIVPGWFRTQSLAPVSEVTTLVSMSETLLGTIIGTLLILAVRRRFRR